MKPLSVGRVPRGVLLFSLLAIGSGFSQPVPAAVILSPNVSAKPCNTVRSAPFPNIGLDCTHQLEYLGQFSADGVYSPLSPNRRWYNQQEPAVPTNFQRDGQPLARPVEVPKFVNLHPQEKVKENLIPPSHAVKAIRGQSRLAVFRDHVVTFVYGREQSLLAPQHLTIDSKGRMLISDPVARAVHVLDGTSSFRITGGDRHRLRKPGGIAVDAEDNIYVADSALGLVEVYDPRGTFLRYIGKIDDETLFDFPTGIAIDRTNARMYLLDTPRNVLLILNLKGNILKCIGRHSTNEVTVEFRYPTEIAMSDEEIIVLDAAGSHIQVLDLDGNLLRQFNTYTSSSPGIPQMPAEMGLGTDAEGNIYLSNFRDSGVRIFNRDGKIVSSFGKQGDREGQFNCPTGVWVQNGRLFIADTVNRRIAVFKINTTIESSNTLLASGE
jgi:DNA-binding beta-propeller fold protein YncE